MSGYSTNTSNTPDGPKKPSGGAAVGTFFVCWFIGALCCALSSMAFANANGLIGYSVGGFGTFIVAICCAAYYKSSGKLGIALLIAGIIGIAIGVLAVQLAKSQLGI